MKEKTWATKHVREDQKATTEYDERGDWKPVVFWPGNVGCLT